ncbi:MAG: alpha/beta hydrolase [Saprospiraceae bacterium]|nr:alpha/beta hydrolase [Saprospiraceae bacterium]
MEKILLLILIACFLIVNLSIGQESTPEDIEKGAIHSSRYWLDIDYIGDRHIGHRLDIHLPAKTEDNYPVVICIYGSAWFSNNFKSRAFKNGIGQYLLNNGFAVVTINHRSSKDAISPAQIHDVKAAIRFVRANAASFSLDDSFIGITGWSSGGHLAAIAGTTNMLETYYLDGDTVDLEGSLGKHTQTKSHVDAVVDWFGPTDFLVMDSCGSSISHDDAKSPESSLVGGPIQISKKACKMSDPATYVNNDNPPFLIFHGDQDPLVPDCQSEHLYQRQKAAGATSTLVIVEQGKHGPGVMINKYYEQMISFFKSNMKP